MASMLSMQIQCPVCLNALREPVCLPCEHSYCRVCITRHLAVSADDSTCPECRTPFSREDIKVNRALRNIVDAAAAHLEEHHILRQRAVERGQNQSSTDQCPEHLETFKLYCETDQKLICVVCREEQRHQGHSCKTVSAALQAKKEIAAEKLETLFTENEKLVDLIESQADEIIKTRWWGESGQSLIRETSSVGRAWSPVEHLGVTPDSLFLGPYETHLQFFVWKQMLTSIQPVPHHHAVELRGNPSVKVAPSGLSVWCKKDSFTKNKYDSPWLKTESSFRTGRYYWEVEVGQKLEWEIGICSSAAGKDIKDTVLCYSSDLGYHVQQGGHGNKRKVHASSRPRRIGVYLDCERKQVSFYDADSMTLMDTGTYVMTTCAHSLCLGPGQYRRGKNSDPLTVCWY